MTSRVYQRALVRAKKEMIALLKQRQQVDDRISRLKITIASLDALRQDSNPTGKSTSSPVELEANSGLTKSIRQILQGAAPLAVSANEIKQVMEQQGFDFGGYTSPLASIHTVLNRLVKKGLAEPEKAPGNLKTYRWYTDTEIALGLLGDPDDSNSKEGFR